MSERKRFVLMNKDNPVAEILMQTRFGTEDFRMGKQYDSYLPYGFSDVNTWLDGRQAAKHRKQIKKLMKECGIYEKSGFISMTRCLSLTDTFWVRPEDEPEKWADISLYRNPFDEVIASIAFDGAGMYGRQFTSTSPELGTDGSFEKCWVRDENQDIFLLKRGSSGASNTGFEPYSEKLASDLGDAMGSAHVPYTLIMHHGHLASKCPIFTSEQYGYVSMASYLGRPAVLVDVMEEMQKYGFEESFAEMLVFDAVTMNVDRHLGNFGFLVDNDTGKPVQIAPLFDHNLSLLPYMMERDDLHEYMRQQGLRLGDDFVKTARSVMSSQLRSILINLKDYSYADPGFSFPAWKLDRDNLIKNLQINEILGK